MRWTASRRAGSVSPADFIPIAEECGPDRADRRMGAADRVPARPRSWPGLGARRGQRLAASSSPTRRLPAIVTSALAQSGIAAARLELEITEGVFLDDDARRERDVRRAEGASACAWRSTISAPAIRRSAICSNAPFDKIKIDQSLRARCDRAGQPQRRDHQRDRQRSPTALGMETTAEGVETQTRST